MTARQQLVEVATHVPVLSHEDYRDDAKDVLVFFATFLRHYLGFWNSTD